MARLSRKLLSDSDALGSRDRHCLHLDGLAGTSPRGASHTLGFQRPRGGCGDGASVFFGWLLGVAGAAALLGSVLVLVPLSGKWVQRRDLGLPPVRWPRSCCSMWLGSTVPSLDVADPFTVELGAWVLLTFIAPCYGLIPLFLLPPGNSPPVNTAETVKVEPLVPADSTTVAWSRTVS